VEKSTSGNLAFFRCIIYFCSKAIRLLHNNTYPIRKDVKYMGKIFNMESNNSPEFNALVSLYSGKGKKFITRQYKLDAEAVNRVIAVKAMLDETAGWIKNGEVKSVRIDNAGFLKICNLDEVFMAKNDNGQIILSSMLTSSIY
jgi:hypothetical protein